MGRALPVEVRMPITLPPGPTRGPPMFPGRSSTRSVNCESLRCVSTAGVEGRRFATFGLAGRQPRGGGPGRGGGGGGGRRGLSRGWGGGGDQDRQSRDDERDHERRQKLVLAESADGAHKASTTLGIVYIHHDAAAEHRNEHGPAA